MDAIGLLFEEDNPFTRLAEDVRQGEVPHVKAGHLVRGDLVMIEGWVLGVADVKRHGGLAALTFDLGMFAFALLLPADERVEVVRLARGALCL